MAQIIIPPVQPGDVIQASAMNLMIQAISDLYTQVALLQRGSTTTTTGPPHITDFQPRTNLHEGDTLTVSGQNLFAGGMNSVYADLSGALTQVTTFSTQTDSLLVFKIPGVGAVASGSFVTLRVVSPVQGGDSVSFMLLPAPVVIPTGDIRVQLSANPATVFNAPGTYALNYTLNANTTLGDTYDLAAAASGAGWIVATDVPSVFIAAAQSSSRPTIVHGTLQITIPAGAVGSANLTLTVTSRLNPLGLSKPSPPAMIPVGGSVLLSNGIGIVPTPPGGSTDANNNLLVPAGAAGLTIAFLVTVTTAGSYNVTPRFDNDAGNWSAQVSSPVSIPTANVPKAVSVVVKAASASAQPSNLYLKIASGDGSIVTETFYPVRVK